jgi:hypothetical protein
MVAGIKAPGINAGSVAEKFRKSSSANNPPMSHMGLGRVKTCGASGGDDSVVGHPNG